MHQSRERSVGSEMYSYSESENPLSRRRMLYDMDELASAFVIRSVSTFEYTEFCTCELRRSLFTPEFFCLNNKSRHNIHVLFLPRTCKQLEPV